MQYKMYQVSLVQHRTVIVTVLVDEADDIYQLEAKLKEAAVELIDPSPDYWEFAEDWTQDYCGYELLDEEELDG